MEISAPFIRYKRCPLDNVSAIETFQCIQITYALSSVVFRCVINPQSIIRSIPQKSGHDFAFLNDCIPEKVGCSLVHGSSLVFYLEFRDRKKAWITENAQSLKIIKCQTNLGLGTVWGRLSWEQIFWEPVSIFLFPHPLLHAQPRLQCHHLHLHGHRYPKVFRWSFRILLRLPLIHLRMTIMRNVFALITTVEISLKRTPLVWKTLSTL